MDTAKIIRHRHKYHHYLNDDLKSVKEEKEFSKISIDNRFILQAVKSIVKDIQEYDYYFIHQGKKNPSPFITYYSVESIYRWYDEIEKFVKDGGGDISSKTENEKLLDDINKIFEDVFLWARDACFDKLRIIVQTIWTEKILILHYIAC